MKLKAVALGVLLLFLLSNSVLAQEPEELCKEQGKTVIASDVCGNGIGSSYPGPNGDPTGHCKLNDCCNWYQTDHIHDLGKIIAKGDLIIEYSPGFTAGCNDTVLVDVSPDQINWTPVASFPTTSVDTCPPNQCWKHYVKKIHNVTNFRYVHIVIPKCYNDYSAAYVCGEECPEGCECLTKEEAYKLGYKLCNDVETVCGETSTGEVKYCWEKLPECPAGCECLTKEEADKLGLVLCQGEKTICGYDDNQNPKYCYEKPECPEGCKCLTMEEADKLGYKLCNDQMMFCGVSPDGYSMYCFKVSPTPTPTLTPTPTPIPTPTPTPTCPKGCCCLTKEEAEKYGGVLCNGVETVCGYDEHQNPKYCFNVTLRVACMPTECICLTEKEAKKKGLQLCHEGICNCTDTGEPKYCYKMWPPCPEGCTCLTKEEAREKGWNLCEGKERICGRTVQNENKYCFKIPVATPTPTPTLTQVPCNFSVSISPKTAKLPSGGGNITYTFSITAPSGFTECIECTLYVKGPVSTTYPLGTICPPYPQTFKYTLNVPAKTPPGTYTGTVVCQACGQKRSDTTALTIPGFEFFAAVAGVAIAYAILNYRRH